jgi:hypothetical protein
MDKSRITQSLIHGRNVRRRTLYLPLPGYFTWTIGAMYKKTLERYFLPGQ